MDADHLDIYGTPQALEEAFIQFAGQVKPGGLLVYKYGLHRENELKASKKYSYSLSDTGADVYAGNIRVENGGYRFDVLHADWQLQDLQLYMGGLHNIENCLAAVTVAKHLGIHDDLLKDAVAAFRGVHRRFELALATDQHTVIDDYAHHPEELRALISGVRSIYSDKKIVLVFQPHLFSRTKDLADGFAESLDMADEVILLPIYPARELPVEGVNSLLIAGKMEKAPVSIMDRQDLLIWIERQKPALVVMAGAGDIDRLVQPVTTILGGKQ
jgi:UDP-N-acetylmuramate--alanine ligase